jgi:hypothetical protein
MIFKHLKMFRLPSIRFVFSRYIGEVFPGSFRRIDNLQRTRQWLMQQKGVTAIDSLSALKTSPRYYNAVEDTTGLQALLQKYFPNQPLKA